MASLDSLDELWGSHRKSCFEGWAEAEAHLSYFLPFFLSFPFTLPSLMIVLSGEPSERGRGLTALAHIPVWAQTQVHTWASFITNPATHMHAWGSFTTHSATHVDAWGWFTTEAATSYSLVLPVGLEDKYLGLELKRQVRPLDSYLDALCLEIIERVRVNTFF